MAGHPAEVDEVFLGRRPLREIGPLPLRDEELGGDVLRHGRKYTLPRPGGATLDAAALDRASRVHGRTAVYAPL